MVGFIAEPVLHNIRCDYENHCAEKLQVHNMVGYAILNHSFKITIVKF